MDGLLTRTGFGCGRLGGGLEERKSRRLLATAVACGIRYFDTAPSYGWGASERVLGQGLRDLRNDVQLCTKVGFARPQPNVRAVARAFMIAKIRVVLPEAVVARLNRARRAQVQKQTGGGGHGNFELASVRSSVQKSLQELQTDHLDCLMLHEPRLSDPDVDLRSVLRQWVADGTARRIGVATGMPIEFLPRFGDVAQFAVDRAVVRGDDGRALIGHGLLRGLEPEVFEHCVRESGILGRIPALTRYLSDPFGSSALLLNAVLFGTEVERVLISTTSPRRLQKFMSAAKEIYGDVHSRGGENDAALWRNVVARYFTEKTGREHELR